MLRSILVSIVMAATILVGPSGLRRARAMKRNGEFEIRVIDQQTNKPIAVRMHLRDARGRVVKPKKTPFWKDHFVFFGQIVLDLRPGRYTFEMERGPEYPVRYGNFLIDRGATDNQLVTMRRFVNMRKEGWWSGDLHIHRNPKDIMLLMQAEDLQIAPVITWWNNQNLWTKRELPDDPLVRLDGNRYYHLMAGEDEREGGALMYFGRMRPLAIAGSTREYPSPMKFVEEAKRDQAIWVDIEKPFWWDVPIWLASGKVDSVGLANNHMCRSRMYESEAWGRPRDEDRLPPPRGNGLWTQEIYYHMLNCGLRVPPSAGSASGVLPNPLGYDRVYVHCSEDFTYEGWWEGLKAGRSFVTNGPLLIVKANGHLPGHVFTADEGGEVKIESGGGECRVSSLMIPLPV